MFINRHLCIRRYHTGVSLVEVIIFIIIISVGVVGLISTMNVTLKASADPMLRKQSIAIAESLLEEIQLQAFTYCDPDDPKNQEDPPPTSAAGCTGLAGGPNDQSIAPDSTTIESRGSVTKPFDNVMDYSGFAMNAGIRSIDDVSNVIVGLENYKAEVTITQVGAAFSLPVTAALLIAVTVTDPNGQALTISGYRFRYAPVATP